MYDNTKWVEQAMDLFLSEFPAEAPLVQLRALRKFDIITTAIMFCKIGPDVRKEWVQEIRQVVGREESDKLAGGEKNQNCDGTITVVTGNDEMEGIAAAATATMATQ